MMITHWFSAGEKHISRTGQHPHIQHHRSAVCRAMVPCDSAQCPFQGRRCRRGENHKCLFAAQVSLPDYEHPANGTVQRVCRVCHQQLPHIMRRLGASPKCQKQGRSSLCTGAHPTKHREGKGTRCTQLSTYCVIPFRNQLVTGEVSML